MSLTKQQQDPHEGLVECRNAIESALNLPKGANERKEAAAICNHLTDKQVDAVLAGGVDATKILNAIKDVAEEETKTAGTKKASAKK